VAWSARLGRFAGIDVYVHVTFLLLLGWIAWSAWVATGSLAGVLDGLVLILLLFLCVLLHEFGHALAARRYGIATRHITLLPIGGVAALEAMPQDPRQEIVVALAGPAVNLAIAALLYLVLEIGGRPGSLLAFDPGGGSLLPTLLAANVILLLFNLLPAFPMDGGRVLRALLATRLGHVRATEIAASIGQVVAFGLGFLGLFGNPLLIFIAIFVYLAAASEAQLVAIRAMSRDVPVNAAMMTQIARLSPDAHIDEAVTTLLQTSQSEFPVVDADGRLAGVLSRADMIRALKERGPDSRVADAMTKDVPTIGHRACLDEAFRLLQEKQAPAVGVVDAAGRLAGLITSETVGEMLMVREALPQGARVGPWSKPAGA
jgi:Zn-dependent protease/CBS domain-containing protein